MMWRISMRVVVACGLLGGMATVCAGQAYTPPPPPLTTLPPCPVDKDTKKPIKRKDCDATVYPPEKVVTKKKDAADGAPAAAAPAGAAPTAGEKFPFPGEAAPAAVAPDTSAAKRFPYPGEAAPAAAPAPDTSAAKKFPYPGDSTPLPPPGPAPDTPAGKKFPYPGDPAPAPGAAKPDEAAPSSSSSTSSSSSSDDAAPLEPSGAAGKGGTQNPDDDDDSAPPKLKDKGSQGSRSKKIVKPQTDDERVDEDLSIAKYYGQSGNSMGAYLRAKDAVKLEPDYAEGHFVLGEAAKRLNKKDEAVTEFTAYLKLAPDGERAKAAEKALEELR